MSAAVSSNCPVEFSTGGSPLTHGRDASGAMQRRQPLERRLRDGVGRSIAWARRPPSAPHPGALYWKPAARHGCGLLLCGVALHLSAIYAVDTVLPARLQALVQRLDEQHG